MAKKIVRIEYCSEVAPSPVVFPIRPSHCPKLETIREERAEELLGQEAALVVNLDLNFNWFNQILSHFRVGLSQKVHHICKN
ncbi:hypothetical protein CDL12_15196 [Handroanthus impetiginosus]|uniref:Uncharacterized protein n=1 Tax=Handroanthus impetiginosus TaxID=429701 RepID=A0A2G9H3U7_9LAMI|nr:hypothetical protein CDL12_15196 [Handroanthus impetiginosus]